jgi:isoamylase
VHGPYNAAQGLRCNPAKLLLDPYARAVRGEVTFGPEVFDYSWDDHDAPSSLDSAGHVPLSLVADAAFDWGSDALLRRDFADTVVYEVHVKGSRMTPFVHICLIWGLRRSSCCRCISMCRTSSCSSAV